MEGEKLERIQARRAGLILGVSFKTVKRLAMRGEIKGILVGRVWTFDEAALRKWVSDKEGGAQCQKPKSKKMKTSTKETASGTPGFKEKMKTYADHYERLMSS